MGNIFKGLAASGCWGCFDEFNRLSPEVLSVCSVQFKAVTDAIKAGKERFIMEDDEVDIDPTCGAYITMNPGYAGRAELPEGLKTLFRPITVVVPDLQLICENILMAEGFVDAKVLARKFVTLYKLCKDLLSKQLHYDWGLRAIKSVLVVAGEFKRAEPDKSEASLLFRALRDFNYPKIASVDMDIFNGLLLDLFPGVNPPRKVNPELEKAIKKVSVDDGFTPNETFLLKIVQLAELLEIRHSVFLLGNAAVGRTTTWRMLAKANGELGQKTTFQDLDPKVVSTRDLYGYTNLTTKEWKNGLMSHYMQYFSEEVTDTNPKWIVLDGDLDAFWIESMNSVMDDNKLLTLANNGRIIFKSYMKLILEVRDLKYASPATVSRGGVLLISDDSGYQRACFLTSWCEKNLKDDAFLKGLIEGLFEKYITIIVNYLYKECKFVIPTSFFSMTMTMCRLLQNVLKNEKLNITTEDKNKPIDAIKLEHLFCVVAVWSYGGALLEKDGKDYRKEFSNWWRNEFKPVKFPAKGSVFDYYVHFDENQKCTFEEWKKKMTTIEYDPSVAMQSVTVPIPETVS